MFYWYKCWPFLPWEWVPSGPRNSAFLLSLPSIPRPYEMEASKQLYFYNQLPYYNFIDRNKTFTKWIKCWWLQCQRTYSRYPNKCFWKKMNKKICIFKLLFECNYWIIRNIITFTKKLSVVIFQFPAKLKKLRICDDRFRRTTFYMEIACWEFWACSGTLMWYHKQMNLLHRVTAFQTSTKVNFVWLANQNFCRITSVYNIYKAQGPQIVTWYFCEEIQLQS